MSEVTLADVEEVLRGSYTEAGIERWWIRPRRSLDMYTPEEYWTKDPARVLELAKRGY
jgi:hypothetical protein